MLHAWEAKKMDAEKVKKNKGKEIKINIKWIQKRILNSIQENNDIKEVGSITVDHHEIKEVYESVIHILSYFGYEIKYRNFMTPDWVISWNNAVTPIKKTNEKNKDK